MSAFEIRDKLVTSEDIDEIKNNEYKHVKFVHCVFPDNCSDLFHECSVLEALEFVDVDTSKVTNMYEMFSKCRCLKELDLSCFNTSNVTNMFCMFRDCKQLEKINISSFDTSKVTDMSDMFYKCRCLKELDVSHFNTSNVDDVSNMFFDCMSLKELDLSHFDVSNICHPCMFHNVDSLEKVVFNTSNARTLIPSLAHSIKHPMSLKVVSE